MVNFDGDPTADSEQYNKLERPVRDECESRVSSVSSSFLCSRFSYLMAMHAQYLVNSRSALQGLACPFYFAALSCIARHGEAYSYIGHLGAASNEKN